MAELTERQIKEQDIDWYCLVKGRLTHIASMGGMIPRPFRDREILRLLQDAVAGIEPFTEVKLNMPNIQSQIEKGYEYLQDVMIRQAIEEANNNNPGFVYLDNYELAVRLYASTFVDKARRGFCSYARLESAEKSEYVLIAEPASHVEYKAGEIQLAKLECKVEDEGRRIIINA